MNVLVTGGSGRLGTVVTTELLAHGHNVINIDQRPPANPPKPPSGQRYHYRETNLADVGQVAGSAEGCDAVIHLGAIPWPGDHADEVVYTRNTNATFAVLQACRLMGVRKAVLASTLATLGITFGPNPQPPRYVPVDEDHPLIPSDPYGLGKLVDEQIGAMFHRQSGMQVAAFRFHWLATAEESRSAAASTAQHPERGNKVLWGYLDIRDAALACRLAVEADGLGFEQFVIAAADTLSEIPTAALLERYAPATEVRSPIPGTASAFSTGKAKRLLGFEPQHSWRDADTLQ